MRTTIECRIASTGGSFARLFGASGSFRAPGSFRTIYLTALAASLLLLLAATGCRKAPVDVFPTGEWETDASGLPADVVQSVDSYVRTLETTGLMIVRHGKVAYTYGDVTEVSYIASVRKSVLSMLYGSRVMDGTIRLDATLEELGMSDVGGLLPTERRARVIDLITARSGVYHPASNSGDLLGYAPERGSLEPGTWWLYNNWDFNAAGAVFEQASHTDVYDALRDELAIPIGMQDFDRLKQQKDVKPEVSVYPAYTMWLSTRDMARLGYLMLRHGRWEGRQIIPAEWVERSTSIVTPVSETNPDFMRTGPFGYGYMWWVWDGPAATGPYLGAYTASGAHGQWITVLPALDMVIAHKTFWASAGPRHNVRNEEFYRLLDLVTGVRPATAEEMQAWARQADAIRSDP